MAQLSDSERAAVLLALDSIETLANLVRDVPPENMRRVQGELTSAASEIRKQLDLDSDV